MDNSAADIFNRMLRIIGSDRDKELAAQLGISPQAVSNARKKGRVPSDLILCFAGKHHVSVDWLISGNGSSHTPDISPHWVSEKPEAYADPVAAAFLHDWLQLPDVVKMRIWTLVKEELEKLPSAE